MTLRKHRLSFKERVLRAVSAIPSGTVRTYREIASRAGSPRAYRAVGTILSHNVDPKVPCHRVIRSDGQLGEYNRGAEKKKMLLRSEGAIS